MKKSSGCRAGGVCAPSLSMRRNPQGAGDGVMLPLSLSDGIVRVPGWEACMCSVSVSLGNNEDKLSLFGRARREFEIIFALMGTMSTWNLICCGCLI